MRLLQRTRSKLGERQQIVKTGKKRRDNGKMVKKRRAISKLKEDRNRTVTQGKEGESE